MLKGMLLALALWTCAALLFVALVQQDRLENLEQRIMVLEERARQHSALGKGFSTGLAKMQHEFYGRRVRK
jgi:hypothetical protein